MIPMSKMTLTAAGCLAAFLIGGCASVDSDVKVPSGAYSTHDLFSDPVLNAPNPAPPPANMPYGVALNWVMPLIEVDTSRFIYPKGISQPDAEEKDKTPI